MALPTLNTFTANTKIESSKVNENFTNLRNRTEVSSSTDHIVITAGTSKLVKITVLRQDNTTDTYTANSVILTGWGFIAGDDAGAIVTETVTFGITFSEIPVAIGSSIGFKASSDPSNIGDVGGPAGTFRGSVGSITVSQLTASIRRVSENGADPGVLPSATRFLYAWIAVGSLT